MNADDNRRSAIDHPEPATKVELDLLRQGDSAAFERFIRRWERQVLNLAYRLTGEVEDARDVRQIAFLRAYVRLRDFQGESAISTWLFRIVINLCRDHQRRKRLHDSRLVPIEQRPTAEGTVTIEPEHEELQRLVRQAIHKLPDSEREVVVLRHYQQLSFGEIAEVLHTPRTTVKSRMHRALRRLRDHLSRSPSCRP